MTGKHIEKKGKKKRLLRWSFLLFLMVMVGVGAAGYLYGKVLEDKFHRGNDGKLDSLVSAPKPGRPVTFVVMGSDSRGKDRGRSDTLMIVRINPKKKIVTILSVPRDLRVRIPGYGVDKINAAYSEGGSDLAIQTVQDFTDFEINHYVEVDFQGFKSLIDAMGGIDIDVQPPNGYRRLYDPENDIDIPKGRQHLDGEQALGFVRIRSMDDDFGRMKRQQQFLKAVFDKAIKPSSLARLPELVQIMAENVKTDSGLGLREMLGYAQLLRSVPKGNIHMATLPGDCQTIDGVSYVVPDDEKLAWVLERTRNDQPFEQSSEELANASIAVDVRNGSGVGGQGQAMADELKLKGFTIDQVGNADSFDYQKTRILASPDGYEKAKKIRDALGLGEIITDQASSASTSVVVVVGRDFAEKKNGPSKTRG